MIRSRAFTSAIAILLYGAWFALLPVSISSNLPAFGRGSESNGCCSKGCCCARAGHNAGHHCECCEKKGSCDCGVSTEDDAVKSILILRAVAMPRPARIHPAGDSALGSLTPTLSPVNPDLVIPTPPPKLAVQI